MKWSVIRRKLARVDKAIDKAIEKADIPGAVVLARMPRDGELVEHESVRGLGRGRGPSGSADGARHRSSISHR